MRCVCNRVKVCASSSSVGFYNDNCHSCFEDENHILRRHFWGALFLFFENIPIFFVLGFSDSCYLMRLLIQSVFATNIIMGIYALVIDHHMRKNWPIILIFSINMILRLVGLICFFVYDFSDCKTSNGSNTILFGLFIEIMVVFLITMIVGIVRSIFYCVKCALGKIVTQEKELSQERKTVEQQNQQIRDLENKIREMNETNDAVPIAIASETEKGSSNIILTKVEK